VLIYKHLPNTLQTNVHHTSGAQVWFKGGAWDLNTIFVLPPKKAGDDPQCLMNWGYSIQMMNWGYTNDEFGVYTDELVFDFAIL